MGAPAASGAGGFAEGGGLYQFEGGALDLERHGLGRCRLGGAGRRQFRAGGTGGDASGGGLYSGGGYYATFDSSTGTYTETPVPSTVTATGMTFLGDAATGDAGAAGSSSSTGGDGGTGAGGALYRRRRIDGDHLRCPVLVQRRHRRPGRPRRYRRRRPRRHRVQRGSSPVWPLVARRVPVALHSLVIGNLAQGGHAGSGGTAGQGIGGGLYLAAGSTTTLNKTIVAGNRASTSNNNIDGAYVAS